MELNNALIKEQNKVISGELSLYLFETGVVINEKGMYSK